MHASKDLMWREIWKSLQFFFFELNKALVLLALASTPAPLHTSYLVRVASAVPPARGAEGVARIAPAVDDARPRLSLCHCTTGRHRRGTAFWWRARDRDRFRAPYVEPYPSERGAGGCRAEAQESGTLRGFIHRARADHSRVDTTRPSTSSVAAQFRRTDVRRTRRESTGTAGRRPLVRIRSLPIPANESHSLCTTYTGARGHSLAKPSLWL